MTHPNDPQNGRETVAFGSTKRSGESITHLADESSRPAGEVDAWYSEDEPDDSKEAQPSWFATRWRDWQSVDRDRRIIIVLGVITVIALLVAAIGLGTRSETTAIELPAVESHGLNPDEAVCFTFGLIENRFEVRLGEETLETSDLSDVSGDINQEIQALDNLAAEHPEADYRLITAFAAVADAGTTASDTESFADYRNAVAERAEAVDAAVDACDEVANFDVAELEPN